MWGEPGSHDGSMVWALLRRTEVWAAHGQQEVSGFHHLCILHREVE